MVPLLANAIHENRLANGTFVEPFAGSAAAAIHLLLGEHVERIAINDFDYNIYCLWWSILNRTEQLADLIASSDVTIEQWRVQQDIYRKPGRFGKLRVGFATLFLNRCNRSGILTSAGPIGGFRQTGKWKIDARFNREALTQQVCRIAAFRERIELHNRDGLDFLSRTIARRTPPKQTFVFLDPPYFEKADRLYKSDFDLAKHARLSRHLLSTAQYNWLLTYDCHTEAQRLYRSRRPIEYCLPYAANAGSKKGIELLVRSPRLRVDSSLLPAAA